MSDPDGYATTFMGADEMARYARAARREANELRQLLEAFVDAAVLHDRRVTLEQFDRACVLCGRMVPPWRKADP